MSSVSLKCPTAIHFAETPLFKRTSTAFPPFRFTAFVCSTIGNPSRRCAYVAALSRVMLNSVSSALSAYLCIAQNCFQNHYAFSTVLLIISFCKSVSNRVKYPEYPVTRTTRFRYFSGSFCAAISSCCER